ncbi:nitrite reductase large subunit NirB [Aestuariirhabdus sp. Z084]|uniref:nitrite reductase large subunit NirB n=1 Tax=Aestuariirhabdus haliotis TaxID=2918751 RepID=UPI00201B3A97|nr:nitrite reductase large subunit NirB [Aestuariirhabdus haliotis]MCL6416271.1 nitrite reductase large subunit NirB [Aestuariirhabdus haliotis]MCL6420269.1 nitrite reductase large subunit NirB [Aestuariirhabdus haliotis]
MSSTSKQRIIVIGNGMVGHQFIESLLASEQADQFSITTFSEEPRPAYDRVHLSEYFANRSADPLAMATEAQYLESGVEILLGDKVVSIDRQQRQVSSANGKTLSYDKLVLATGSYPFVPPIEGNDRKDCFVYRTIEDLEAITASAEAGAKVGTVIGGGLLGLEAAKALTDLGMEAHVVEFAPRLMAVQLDDGGGALLKQKIEDLGVGVHLSKATSAIVDGERCQHRMSFADGESLETDMVVFSAGIRPQDELARSSDLEIGERGGIVINNQCQTSDPDIYAIGECALWNQRIFGLVAPGYQMAKVAVSHIIGGDATFTGADMSTKLKLMGVDVASIGDAQGLTPGARIYNWFDEPDQVYKKIVVSEDKRHLLGAVLVGDAEEYGTLLQYMLNDIALPEYPESLILPNRGDDGQTGLGVGALPETAQICSCHDVSKGDIRAAIDGGCCSVGDVKGETKAGTGCGGCAQLLTSLVNHELEERGVSVNRDLCEHFPYTRQELYHLVRVGRIETFAELIDQHGQGHGCEICKPAVANILASCWNDYVLKRDHIGLQDTNDIYLGNMQKDGTYSIVPRIAGGEITPEKLIVIGEVAKQYGLYTKITGGQRIDLFGAQLHELPDIWRVLVDAGFETGHAYGKSVRTVKSCVGSSWCRFGVDDSVGLAIEIEDRYKGLRAPHKLKFAVSGCTRECAEAQSKDIGVIATENGWNLYVCGNGGMKPRHADLFATDLDHDTLIKTIDRILMFYIRTADRLQRTSVWMENLEGGLDYLRDVILEDSLGLAEDLEAEMALNIENYQCEWATTLDDEQKLKRFSHFINNDETDSNLVFVEERQQRRPASDEERSQLIAKAS